MDQQTALQEVLQQTIKALKLSNARSRIEVTIPQDFSFGDYTTNCVFALAKQNQRDVNELGQAMVDHLLAQPETLAKMGIESVELKKGGFINFRCSTQRLLLQLSEVLRQADDYGKGAQFADQKVMVEYTDPNPFKVFHIGHLMTNTIGESLARVCAFCGAEVKRANYQGDVGMHVAKSIWGIQQLMQEQGVELGELEERALTGRIEFLGQAYAYGANQFEVDTAVAEEIKDINYLVYLAAQEYLVEHEGWEPRIDYQQYLKIDAAQLAQVRELYQAGRGWSLAYFERLYQRLGTKFDYYYFESKVGEYGVGIVQEQLAAGVFAESEGAIVFFGEDFGLHTRVFINRHGLPVYEAKDLGLAVMKYADYPYDHSYIVTGNEINEYFQVVLKALAQFAPELAERTTHLGHGMLRLKTGKMSSRTGQIIAGEDLLDEIKTHVAQMMNAEPEMEEAEKADVVEKVAVAAWKYSVLKHKIGRDIHFDFAESLSLEGNSGPYLLYTYARAKSVLRKSNQDVPTLTSIEHALNESERMILRRIDKFPLIVEQVALQRAPHLMATYLFELAQEFNSFYNQHQILVDESNVRSLRLALTIAVAQVIQNGLHLLGIETVERM